AIVPPMPLVHPPGTAPSSKPYVSIVGLGPQVPAEQKLPPPQLPQSAVGALAHAPPRQTIELHPLGAPPPVPSAAGITVQPPAATLHVPVPHAVDIAEQSSGAPPAHAPPRHASPVVHGLPSLHVVPSPAGIVQQVPLAGLHAPTTQPLVNAEQS